ncbi:hypothetical protein L195_g005915 [Trifolium pratense]|uniref:Uncharacterized protein n=1 Tax=Trifolium pratense TaxID=57577 RepID=A0A2K3P246_TRIPR|nr:hypothetical protein L195_g005915 [Trifolium pratense]
MYFLRIPLNSSESHEFVVTGYLSEEKLGKALEGADVVKILSGVKSLATAIGNYYCPCG